MTGKQTTWYYTCATRTGEDDEIPELEEINNEMPELVMAEENGDLRRRWSKVET